MKRGRPPVPDEKKAQVLELRRSGLGYKRIANATGLGRTTVRRILRDASDGSGGLFSRTGGGRDSGPAQGERGA